MVVGALCCITATAVLLLTNRNGNLNPVESFILRLRLSTAQDALNRPAGSDPTAICFPINVGDTASSIAVRLQQRRDHRRRFVHGVSTLLGIGQ
ncbi:MAG: hypothetical protein U0528_17850 [Anaerolineae bacterium]